MDIHSFNELLLVTPEPFTLLLLGWVQWIPLIAAAAGALLSNKGSSQGGTVDTNQFTTGTPDWATGYAQELLRMARPEFKSSLTPSPVQGMSEEQLAKTVRGDYTDPRSNPFLQETFEQAANRVRASMAPSFGHMQAFGQNSGFNHALGRSMKELATNLYGANYSQERDRQFQATMGTPAWLSSNTSATFAPFNQYANLLRGWGSTSVGTQPYFENKGAGMLGGALAGAQIGRMFGGGK